MIVCLEVSAGQRFITFTEHMLLNRSLLEIVSLTQKNAPTGGILAPWLVDISPPPRLYQRVLSLVVPSSVSAQESAQGHWSHTAVVNGLWLISPLQSKLIKAARHDCWIDCISLW